MNPRTSEIALVERLLRFRALVTVTGPPGIGKTYLATTVTARSPQDVLHVRLDTADFSTFVDTLASSLGLHGVPAAPQIAGFAIGEALAARGPLTLLLDHAQELATPLRGFLEDICQRAPTTAVLVTSRQPTGAVGERLVELQPLPLLDDAGRPGAAVTLLIEAIGRFRDGYVPTADELAHLVQIARATDGIPLALELAAGRLRLMALPELVSRLEDERFLLGDPTDVLERTLATAWASLTHAEQLVLAACAAFRGGFTVADVEGIRACPRSPQVVDLLHALRDRSFLHSIGGDGSSPARLGMYAPIRAFASAKLAEHPKRIDIALDHARYFVDAQRASGGTDARRVENLRGALTAVDGAGDTGLFVEVALAVAAANDGGRVTDRDLVLFERARQQAEAAGSAAPLVGSLMREHAYGLFLRGKLSDAELLLRRALAQGFESGDASAELATRRRFAEVLFAQGKMLESLRACDHAMTLATASGDAKTCHGISELRASVLASLGQPGEARLQLERLSDYAYGAGDLAMLARVEAGLASLALETGALERASAGYRRAIQLAQQTGTHQREAIYRGYAAITELAANRHATASEQVRDALRIAREVGHARAVGLFSAVSAAAQAHRGEPTEGLLLDAQLLLEDDPLLIHVLDIYRAYCLVVRADAPMDWLAGVSRLVELRTRRIADARSTAGPPLRAVSDDARIALRLLERRLASQSPASGRRVLRVGAGGGWFQVPEHPRVELSGRPVAQALLWALCVAAVRSPRRRMTSQELATAVYPGEMISRAVSSRLYVAIRELRAIGFAGHLVTGRGGYALDVDVVVDVSE